MRIVVNLSGTEVIGVVKKEEDINNIIQNFKNSSILSCLDNVFSFFDSGLEKIINIKKLRDELNYKFNLERIEKKEKLGFVYYNVLDSYFRLSNGRILILIEKIDMIDLINQHIENDSNSCILFLEKLKEYFLGKYSELSSEEIFKNLFIDPNYTWKCHLSELYENDGALMFDFKNYLNSGKLDLTSDFSDICIGLVGFLIEEMY